MKLQISHLIIGLIFILYACSTNRPLVMRGLPEEERRHFIVQNGFGVPDELKRAFLVGIPRVGMSQEMIFQLYGAPDRTANDDAIWEYVDGKGTLVTGFKFEDKTVVEILGDPRGGLPLEGQN